MYKNTSLLDFRKPLEDQGEVKSVSWRLCSWDYPHVNKDKINSLHTCSQRHSLALTRMEEVRSITFSFFRGTDNDLL